MKHNPLVLADNWLIDRAQDISNYTWTRWDLSPYRIAMNAFMGAGVFGLICSGMRIIDKFDAINIFFLPIGILCATLYFIVAYANERVFQITGKKMPPMSNEDSFRWMWTFMVVFGAFGMLSGYYSFDIKRIVDVLAVLFYSIGFYFLACDPPSRIEIRRTMLEPKWA